MFSCFDGGYRWSNFVFSMLISFEIIIYIITSVIVIPLVILVNKKLYYNIKHEEHLEKGKVIQHIVKTYSLCQCVGWPCIVLFYGLIKTICYFSQNDSCNQAVLIFRFLYTFFRDYLQFHSLIIAICRYSFIIFDFKSQTFGIAKLRTFFIGASIGVPFFTAILYEITRPIEKTYMYWFYGTTLPQDSPNATDTQPIEPVDFKTRSIPFIIFNEISSPSVVHVVSVVENIVFSIIYSNLIEGCIYTHIFIFLRR